MPKNESSNPNRVPSAQAPRPGPDWIVALACALVGAYLLVALASFDPAQSPGDHVPRPPASNPAGFIGALTAEFLFKGFGVGAWFVPALARPLPDDRHYDRIAYVLKQPVAK